MQVKQVCPHCGQEISKNAYCSHLRRHEKHPESFETPPYRLNHDGLTCQFCGKECKNRNSLCNHERLCRQNPHRQTNNGIEKFNEYRRTHPLEAPVWNKGLTALTDKRVATIARKNSEIKKGKQGHSVNAETRIKISESMKKAHLEGRAHNIGDCRHNNKPSYPEQFFMSVIDNEFLDKNYIREYPIGKYSADFAWVHLKKIIEIDGAQHERFDTYKERDKRKDALIHTMGWQVLRVKWSDMFNDTKKWIQICKDYIHENSNDEKY